MRCYVFRLGRYSRAFTLYKVAESQLPPSRTRLHVNQDRSRRIKNLTNEIHKAFTSYFRSRTVACILLCVAKFARSARLLDALTERRCERKWLKRGWNQILWRLLPKRLLVLFLF
ncbi:hypothetical protein VNO77_08773 [Canavalia gladiata]|uniref:Uncharacterized protein n=1 Tax=Canavalia gladiata TaxID=3824 RepID=A0AAN9M8Q8_CANGL